MTSRSIPSASDVKSSLRTDSKGALRRVQAMRPRWVASQDVAHRLPEHPSPSSTQSCCRPLLPAALRAQKDAADDPATGGLGRSPSGNAGGDESASAGGAGANVVGAAGRRAATGWHGGGGGAAIVDAGSGGKSGSSPTSDATIDVQPDGPGRWPRFRPSEPRSRLPERSHTNEGRAVRQIREPRQERPHAQRCQLQRQATRH